MPELDLDEKCVSFINELVGKIFPYAEIFIYGSRTQGKAREYSDVDIALKGDISFEGLLTVRALFEDSTFPYKVDVVDLNSLDEKFFAVIKDDLYRIN